MLKESNKIPFTFLLVTLVVLLAFPQNTKAQLLPQGIDKQTQIQILTQEIGRLQALINILKVQANHQVNAQSYLVIDLSNNSIILEKNSNIAFSIASITKLMTAVVAKENINLNSAITLNQGMLSAWGGSPSIYNGLSVSAENLLKATLIQSTNDAALSLSYFLGTNNFVALMNQKARELSMTKTAFYDPHGLNLANSSSALDLAKLLNYIYTNHPDLLSITKDNNFWLPDQTGKWLKFRNVNNFYDFPNFIGGKTGYLPESKQTMASIFNINNKPTAIIVLYSDNYIADIFSLLNPTQATIASF